MSLQTIKTPNFKLNSAMPATSRNRYLKTPTDQSENEETFIEGDESATETTKETKLTPTILSKASQCLLRGVLASRGQEGLPPSPFAKESMENGVAFENAIMDENTDGSKSGSSGTRHWLQALNQAGVKLSNDIRLVAGKDISKRNICNETFVNKCTDGLSDLIKNNEQPFAITQPTLACLRNDKLLSGKPDLLIWTGEEWIIVDIKCSETARISHGIQITAYKIMLEGMINDIKIHEKGFVIHCSVGLRYTKSNNSQEILDNIRATSFKIEGLKTLTEELIIELNKNTVEIDATKKSLLASYCTECEYRFDCYKRFLQDDDISLMPLPVADIQSLRDVGITKVESLLKTININDSKETEYADLLEIYQNNPYLLKILKGYAETVQKDGLHLSWNIDKAHLGNPLFFAKKDGEKNDIFSHKLHEHRTTPFTALVVYTEGEASVAWGKHLYNKGITGLQTYVLEREIRKNLRGPIPSLTLRPLAAFLSDMQISAKKREDILNYYEETKSKDLEESDPSSLDARLESLKKIWDFLNYKQHEI